MRRLALFCFAFVFAVSASGELRRSDVLLTDAGIIYRVETVETAAYNESHPDAPVPASANSVLVLSVLDGDETRTFPVPESLFGLFNVEPSLAYDPGDDRIYLFWQRKPSPSSSELLLASYKDGEWTSATVFDGGAWRLRYNLRIGITRYRVESDGGRLVRVPAVVAHAVWWEQHGPQESARYAMISLDDGDVTGIVTSDMSALSSSREEQEPRELPDDFDRNILRTPFIFDVAGSDSLDVLFGDWYTNHFELINIRPVLDEKNGVLHVPIGVTVGIMDAPRVDLQNATSAMVATAAPAPFGIARDLLLYVPTEDSIRYVIYRDGSWSEPRRIVLGEAVSLDEATAALHRNLNRH